MKSSEEKEAKRKDPPVLHLFGIRRGFCQAFHVNFGYHTSCFPVPLTTIVLDTMYTYNCDAKRNARYS